MVDFAARELALGFLFDLKNNKNQMQTKKFVWQSHYSFSTLQVLIPAPTLVEGRDGGLDPRVQYHHHDDDLKKIFILNFFYHHRR